MKVVVLLSLLVCIYAQEKDYGIMIDAGSSGSRIYLYEWPHRDNNTLPLVEPTTINQVVINKKSNQSLASFASNPSNAYTSLVPLIDYVIPYIPEAKRNNNTPIYLKATAGMRAIPQSDQDAIIANVRQYLAGTKFQFFPNYSQVISGRDEGIYGWITTNYALQLLVKINPDTYGALDMGGASTQISFVPSASPTEHGYNLPLAENTFDLYTYSYPLGQDQSLRLLLNGLISDNVVDGQGNVLCPCYLVGYNETFNGSSIVGTGNQNECKQRVQQYIVTASPSGCTECGIGAVYQPAPYGKFYGFSGYAYTYQFYGLPNTSSIQDLHNKATEFCATSWADARAAHPTEGFLKQYCFTATYYEEVWAAYGFAADSTNIIVQVAIGSIELTWALGAMILEASLLPYGPITRTSDASSIFVSAILYLVTIASLLL